MVDLAKANKFWKKFLGYSDDSEDMSVGFNEINYRKTKNPIYVWKAITRMDEIQMTKYPKWVRDYLVTSAKQLEVCEPVPQGQDGVLAAFGIKCSKLRIKDTYNIDRAYDLMCGRIRSGMTIEDAALEVEYMIDQGDLKPGHLGFLGNSKLEKEYRKLRKERKEGWALEDIIDDMDDYIEKMDRHEGST